MSQIQPSELLEGWVYWIFQQRWGSDIGNDSRGATTEELNAGSDIWYLSGTWGDAGPTPDKVIRKIRIKKETSLFIVLASSHATPQELTKKDADDEDLLQHAKAVHKLWDKTELRIGDKDKPEQTQKIETPVLTPFISDGSYYAGLAKSGVVRMATVAEVCLLDSNRLSEQGPQYNIELDAHSRKGEPALAEPDEPEYREDVRYEITVQ